MKIYFFTPHRVNGWYICVINLFLLSLNTCALKSCDTEKKRQNERWEQLMSVRDYDAFETTGDTCLIKGMARNPRAEYLGEGSLQERDGEYSCELRDNGKTLIGSPRLIARLVHHYNFQLPPPHISKIEPRAQIDIRNYAGLVTYPAHSKYYDLMKTAYESHCRESKKK
jgi:hypothetical protein